MEKIEVKARVSCDPPLHQTWLIGAGVGTELDWADQNLSPDLEKIEVKEIPQELHQAQGRKPCPWLELMSLEPSGGRGTHDSCDLTQPRSPP